MVETEMNENEDATLKARNDTIVVRRFADGFCRKLRYSFLGVITGTIFGFIVYVLVAGFDSSSLYHKATEINSVDQQLVVVLVSGMRWDQLEVLPQSMYGSGFHTMKENGVRIEYVETVFPGLKLPACTSLQTGVYPKSHEVLSSVMFDRARNTRFDWCTGENVHDPRWWEAAEPIWITATKQKRRVATIEWQNAGVPFKGILPEVAGGYTGSKRSFQDRILETTQYLKQGFQLIMMAYDGLEMAMEKDGLYSTRVCTEMTAIGDGLETLIKFVENSGQNVNILLVSDVGFASACDLPPPLPPQKNATFLLMNANPKDVDVEHVEQHNNLFMVYTRDSRERHVAEKLSGASGYTAHVRSDIPVSLNYCTYSKCPDVLVYASPVTSACNTRAPKTPGSMLRRSQSAWPRVHAEWRGLDGCERRGGVTGLDPKRTDAMRTLFVGWGNAFAGRGLVHPPILLVDVYQIIAHLSRVRAQPNDGTWSSVCQMLGCSSPYGADKNEEDVLKEALICSENFPSYTAERYSFTRKWEKNYIQVRERSGFGGAGATVATATVVAAANAIAVALG